MNNPLFKKILPYLAGLVIFISITLIYLSPVIEGKSLRQSDIANYKGASKEISDYRAQTGKEALWTNSMFGGMPAYQISVIYSGNLMRFVDKIFTLGLEPPAGYVFLYFIGFFFLLVVLGVDVWLAIAGAIAFGFSSFFFIILEVGHNSQAHAIGYMAPVLAGIMLTYRGKYLLGGVLTALFLCLELYSNHPQITYYLGLIVLALSISEFIFYLREKRLIDFAKVIGVLVVAAGLAVLPNIASLWSTYEYSKETIRGKTELTTEKSNRTSGLDKDYATQWSYGKAETFTLLIPHFYGGASSEALSEKSNSYKTMIQNGVPENQAARVNQGLPLYWGNQISTAGPVYVGAILVFLFIFSLLVANNRYRWWLLAATLLSILLSWGKNFMFFTDFFLTYFPAYNKFRAVSMTLVIAEFCIPLLAILGLNQVFSNKFDKKKIIKSLYISAGITAGISLLIFLFSGLFDFVSPSDVEYKNIFPDWLMNAIREDRASLLKTDAIRAVIFILLAAGAVWMLIQEKIKKRTAFLLIAFLILVDMWSIDKNYLNNRNFDSKSVVQNPFQPTEIDQFIMKEKDPDFRVLNLTVNTFNDASTSYFHKSIGGYHGAKLRRYQELIDRQITRNNMNVLDMLNTKYFIVPNEKNEPTMQINFKALGHAWFVNDVRMVNNADEELTALDNFTPTETAIVDKRFGGQLKGLDISKDTTSNIELTEYKPNYLKYNSMANKTQLAVFSEIYYAKGWDAYIDGNRAPYMRANYVLRAMIIPKGIHTIEFKFEPKAYYVGQKISLAGSILLIVLVLGSIGYNLYEHKSKSPSVAQPKDDKVPVKKDAK